MITAAGACGSDVDAGGGEVGFDLEGEAGVAAAGEIGVGLTVGIVGCYGDGG